MGKSSVMFLSPSKLVVAVSVARGFTLSKFGSRNVYTFQVIKDGKVMGATFVYPILNTGQMSRYLRASLRPTHKKTADQENRTVCS